MSTPHTQRTGGRIPVRRDRTRLAHARARARFEWLLLARGRPSKLYGYASRHRGELIHLPWPPYWCLELHHDPYIDARSATVWGHRWGWPPTHVRPRCVQDCGEWTYGRAAGRDVGQRVSGYKVRRQAPETPAGGQWGQKKTSRQGRRNIGYADRQTASNGKRV
uniref:DR6 n=1 Tax=Human betaherpesvirus 6A TaxID=32603 RepID=A0A2L2QE55_9BETA|nr:hypothetical protein [Human betaherpesvirus 6A]AVI09308.1 hypothetical protein [Human betaherpesvirus 6A]